MNINEEQSIKGSKCIIQYEQLDKQFKKIGVTFKSNQIIHRICDEKSYPYSLLIEICKIFHLNQFEIIFLCHILNDEECSYQDDPAIFDKQFVLPDLQKIYNKITKNGSRLLPIVRRKLKNQPQIDEPDLEEEEQVHQNIQEQLGLGEYENENYQSTEYWTWENIRQLFIYLLVIGYSVKYYLNQTIKPYEQEIRKRYPQFFTKVFNLWVDKYSSKVLRTNPKRINQFYSSIFQGEDNYADLTTEVDCQYRNYNQIVEQLIKATTQIEEVLQDDGRQL